MRIDRRRLARRLLWIEAGLVLGATLVMLPSPEAVARVLIAVPILLYGWLGARIAERAPHNRVGWLLSAAAMIAAVALVLVSYTDFGRAHHTAQLPLTPPIRIVNNSVPMPAIGTCLLIAFLLFPTGELPSPRWRAGVWAATIAGSAIAVVSWLWETDVLTGSAQRVTDPILIALTSVAALLTVASLVVRSRRGTPAERAPIRGLLITLLATAVAFALFLVRASQVEWDPLVLIAFMVIVLGVLVGVPFALSVALLRYGLFDYEVGVRKRIAARLLAGLMIVAIAGLLFLVTSALGGLVLAGARGNRAPGYVVALAVGVVAGIVWLIGARWARRFADRVVFRDRATPYEVLSEFSDRVGETYSIDDVLPRMTHLLALGTGAAAAGVWLAVDDDLRPLAIFPDEADPDGHVELQGDDVTADDPSTFAVPVRHQGELLGALTVTMPANDPINQAKERLVRDLAGQAGLVLRNVALIEDLRESRRRIVAAQDERARKLERDLHDGAQQQLVALSVQLRLAEQLAQRDPASSLPETLRALQREATSALENLRDLARGIYPPLLADEGIAAALEAQARKSPVPVRVQADGVGRCHRSIESAVYFCCLEALQNVAKYAEASAVDVILAQMDGELGFEIRDDGVGFDPRTAHHGSGIQGMRDRLAAVDGTLAIQSTPGDGTAVRGRIPLPDDQAAASIQAASSRSGPNTALGM